MRRSPRLLSASPEPIEEIKRLEIPAEDQILYLMHRVMASDLAGYDLPVWQWAQADGRARVVFQRALKKRFEFTTSLFQKAGFSRSEAAHRAHLMVVYMMGESALVRQTSATSQRAVRRMHAILIARNA